MLRNSTKPQLKEASRAKSIYFMTWRWHFYAGLFVIPFMLMLSVTGLVMLFDDEIELARYETTLKVVQQEHKVPVSIQLESVKQAYPDFSVTQFVALPKQRILPTGFQLKRKMGVRSLPQSIHIRARFKVPLIAQTAFMS